MAAARILPLQSLLHQIQPIQLLARQPLISIPFLRRILTPSISPALPISVSVALPTSLPRISTSIFDFLSDLWDGLLRAVPKKKTSHMKKRHRQMAGKALKDVTNFCKCSACGKVKRSHMLCPYCVEAVRTYVKEKVLGVPRYNPSGPKREGQNIAETAPEIWRDVKRNRENRARALQRNKAKDRTQW